MWVGHVFRFILELLVYAVLSERLSCIVLSNLMYLIFVDQDNNVIEQIYVVGHRSCRG